MEFFYGLADKRVNITASVKSKCIIPSIPTIPSIPSIPSCILIPGDDTCRDLLFGDPLPNIHKCIYVVDSTGVETFYNDKTDIIACIDIDIVRSTNIDFPPDLEKSIHNALRLQDIHKNIKLVHQTAPKHISRRLQILCTEFIRPHDTVLEIGAHLGHTSAVLACLTNGNLVTIESSPLFATKLRENMLLCPVKFEVECMALSNIPLIQETEAWRTYPQHLLPRPFGNLVRTESLAYLESKYGRTFTTLVIDCEGAFFYMVRDMPEMLTNITRIIMTNTYAKMAHKEFVDSALLSKGFVLVICEGGGWGPCATSFFQVWTK